MSLCRMANDAEQLPQHKYLELALLLMQESSTCAGDGSEVGKRAKVQLHNERQVVVFPTLDRMGVY